ncbi:hypothetical protein AGMMS50233_04660 [Endomicrobiia bacterium]|nr:hypothetical protein AGMMS50233_04660 [Endomicrobiia bacterium]
MDNHNCGVKPERKTKEEIENEAHEILHYYRPDYLSDLSVNMDPYDFIIEFLPEHIRKTENRQLEVVFEMLDEDLAGYTQYGKVALNKTKFDSNNEVYQRMMNFTIPHEAYHASFHYRYLIPTSQSFLTPFLNTTNKLEKIKTLYRDLHSPKNTNLFCTQANYFAGCFTIPKNRLIKALLEVYGKSCIASRDNFDFNCKILKIAKQLQGFFDMNLEPIKIALEQYGLVKFNENEEESYICD